MSLSRLEKVTMASSVWVCVFVCVCLLAWSNTLYCAEVVLRRQLGYYPESEWARRRRLLSRTSMSESIYWAHTRCVLRYEFAASAGTHYGVVTCRFLAVQRRAYCVACDPPPWLSASLMAS